MRMGFFVRNRKSGISGCVRNIISKNGKQYFSIRGLPGTGIHTLWASWLCDRIPTPKAGRPAYVRNIATGDVGLVIGEYVRSFHPGYTHKWYVRLENGIRKEWTYNRCEPVSPAVKRIYLRHDNGAVGHIRQNAKPNAQGYISVRVIWPEVKLSAWAQDSFCRISEDTAMRISGGRRIGTGNRWRDRDLWDIHTDTAFWVRNDWERILDKAYDAAIEGAPAVPTPAEKRMAA